MWRGERDKGLWRKDERGEYIVCARDLQRKPAPSAYKGGNYAAQPSASSEINVYTLISREAHAWCAVLTRSEGLSFATLSPPLLTATKKKKKKKTQRPPSAAPTHLSGPRCSLTDAFHGTIDVFI